MVNNQMCHVNADKIDFSWDNSEAYTTSEIRAIEISNVFKSSLGKTEQETILSSSSLQELVSTQARITNHQNLPLIL